MAETSAQHPSHLRENLLLGLLYAGFFLIVFLFAAYLTFPYDRLRDLLAARVASSAPAGTRRSLQIGALEPIGLSGVSLKDVEFVQEPPSASSEPIVLELSEVSVHVSPWSLLFGHKTVKLHAAAGGGTLDGEFSQSGSDRHVKAELVRLDLAKLGLGSFVGLPLKGKATGNVDLEIASEPQKSAGTIKLEVRNLHVGDGKAKIKLPALGTGLTLDEIDAGKLELGLQVRDGVATLSRLATDGKDLKLTGKGDLRLTDPLRRSRPDLTLDLSFSDAYKNKSDRTKAMFEIIGMRPEWQHAITPNGTMRVHVGGTLQAIRGGPVR